MRKKMQTLKRLKHYKRFFSKKNCERGTPQYF